MTDASYSPKPTTPEQFAIFKAFVLQWWDLLGLSSAGFRLEIRQEKLEARGECRTQYEGRIVDILLNSELSEVDGTPEILEELAVHECCHALLMPLANLAVQRFVGENELAHAEHEVVRRLQALFRKLVK